jgi:hypothetical protein
MSNEERVFHVLLELGGTGKSSKIAKVLNWPGPGGIRKVGHLMSHLISQHRVERLAPGVYYIPRAIQ